jgi:hypothetical protein
MTWWVPVASERLHLVHALARGNLAGADVAPFTGPDRKGKRTMNDELEEAKPLTPVQLLDAALWREIASEEAQAPAVFLEALSALVGRWLLVRSETPEMDAVTVLCKARGYISRCKLEAGLRRNWQPKET